MKYTNIKEKSLRKNPLAWGKNWGRQKPTHSVEWPQQPKKRMVAVDSRAQLQRDPWRLDHAFAKELNERNQSTKAPHWLHQVSCIWAGLQPLRQWQQQLEGGKSLWSRECNRVCAETNRESCEATACPSLSRKVTDGAGLGTANFSCRLNYKKASELLFIKSLKNEVPRLPFLLNWVAITHC